MLELGEFANFTVIGSDEPSGIVPFNFWIALSASARWSNRINPTPFDKPGTATATEYYIIIHSARKKNVQTS